MVKCINNLAIQRFKLLANLIFHGVNDFACGVVRKSAALGYLGSQVAKEVKKRVHIWMNEEQRLSMFRSIAAESELLGLVRRDALSHEEQYYSLRKARYPEA